MRFITRWVILALFVLGLDPSPLRAQKPAVNSSNGNDARHARQLQDPASARTLTPDDGLSVIASALDTHVRLHSEENDCSHLVHVIYDRAGFPYSYMSSSSLYAGSKEFHRVARPQPGDLVVWRGHVGIVVNPARHEFFSTLSSGPGIDIYDAPYWKERGHLRFYRYIKTSPAPAPPHRLVLTHQSK